jgi:hypothetical protein
MPKDKNSICDDCGELDTHVCYICSNKDSCIVCDKMGEYGQDKHIVCENCLPNCLKCKRKLERRADACCGKGRSDDDVVAFLCKLPPTTKMSSVIMVLPCWGEPYVWKAKVFDEEHSPFATYDELDKVVQGTAEVEWKRSLRIHPMFEGRWGLIRELLSNKKHLDYITIHTNVNAHRDCCPNTACIGLNMSGSCGPFFGDLAIVIPVSCFDNKISVKMFMPVKLPHPWHNDKMLGVFEPYDDEDDVKMNEWCKEHGYDYSESANMVYEKSIKIKKRLRIVDKL